MTLHKRILMLSELTLRVREDLFFLMFLHGFTEIMTAYIMLQNALHLVLKVKI